LNDGKLGEGARLARETMEKSERVHGADRAGFIDAMESNAFAQYNRGQLSDAEKKFWKGKAAIPWR
jgi:hypothetical protein